MHEGWAKMRERIEGGHWDVEEDTGQRVGRLKMRPRKKGRSVPARRREE